MTVLVRDESGDRRPAGIFVDGSRRCDFSPCVVEEPPGEHVITVTIEGAAPMMQSATFRAGGDSTMAFVLPPAVAAPTAIASATPSTAPLPGPSASGTASAATPSRTLVASSATVRDAIRHPVSQGVPCKLQFNSMPVADLNLDGLSIGETPRTNVSAAPGDHRVTFDAGDLKKTVVFRCSDGEEKTIAVRLP
jgi:hypothetical protein